MSTAMMLLQTQRLLNTVVSQPVLTLRLSARRLRWCLRISTYMYTCKHIRNGHVFKVHVCPGSAVFKMLTVL